MFGILTALKNGYHESRISCDYAVMRLGQRFRRVKKTQRGILFVLGGETLDFDDGRNAYLVLSLFSDAGYGVYLHPRNRLGRKAYRMMGHCARMVFGLKNVKLADRIPGASETLCLATDSFEADAEIMRRPWKRRVFLNFLKPQELNPGAAIQMPYSMHPHIHSDKTSHRLESWRQAPRTLRLFFVGNTSEIYYDSEEIRRQGAISRLEALRALKRQGLMKPIADRDAFEESMKSGPYFDGGVLAETGSFRIEPSRWLETLSKCDFFLCLSGTDYPMCHNAIEAMAVGSVPVTGYADWFSPPLEHGKNAVVFSDVKDLEAKVRQVLEMPKEKIMEMRKNAADYYDRHLSAGSFIRRFEAMPPATGTLVLFPMYRTGRAHE